MSLCPVARQVQLKAGNQYQLFCKHGKPIKQHERKFNSKTNCLKEHYLSKSLCIKYKPVTEKDLMSKTKQQQKKLIMRIRK